MKINELCIKLGVSKQTIRNMLKYDIIIIKEKHNFKLPNLNKKEVLSKILDIEGEEYIRKFRNTGIYINYILTMKTVKNYIICIQE